jgi:hypothetical protein
MEERTPASRSSEVMNQLLVTLRSRVLNADEIKDLQTQVDILERLEGSHHTQFSHQTGVAADFDPTILMQRPESTA